MRIYDLKTVGGNDYMHKILVGKHHGKTTFGKT
jgi:hypothetical protein